MSNTQPSRPELSRQTTPPPRCPRCQARMAVQHAVPARSGFEHWTPRCTKCGHVLEAQVLVDPIKSDDATGWFEGGLTPPK